MAVQVAGAAGSTTSTPTVKGLSRIEREYLESDQRRYFVPCPHCGENIKAESGPDAPPPAPQSRRAPIGLTDNLTHS